MTLALHTRRALRRTDGLAAPWGGAAADECVLGEARLQLEGLELGAGEEAAVAVPLLEPVTLATPRPGAVCTPLGARSRVAPTAREAEGYNEEDEDAGEGRNAGAEEAGVEEESIAEEGGVDGWGEASSDTGLPDPAGGSGGSGGSGGRARPPGAVVAGPLRGSLTVRLRWLAATATGAALTVRVLRAEIYPPPDDGGGFFGSLIGSRTGAGSGSRAGDGSIVGGGSHAGGSRAGGGGGGASGSHAASAPSGGGGGTAGRSSATAGGGSRAAAAFARALRTRVAVRVNSALAGETRAVAGRLRPEWDQRLSLPAPSLLLPSPLALDISLLDGRRRLGEAAFAVEAAGMMLGRRTPAEWYELERHGPAGRSLFRRGTAASAGEGQLRTAIGRILIQVSWAL